LALTALALQLALSFGHVHFLERCSSHCGSTVISAIAKVSKIPSPEPVDSKHEYCAVCASIQLADGSLPLPLFQSPSFSLNQTIEHPNYVAALISTSRRSLFQSRAPPLL
jgi:hypothetical protein